MDVLVITSYIECFRVQSGNYLNSITEIRTRWSKCKKYKMKIIQSLIICCIVIKADGIKCKLQKNVEDILCSDKVNFLSSWGYIKKNHILSPYYDNLSTFLKFKLIQYLAVSQEGSLGNRKEHQSNRGWAQGNPTPPGLRATNSCRLFSEIYYFWFID